MKTWGTVLAVASLLAACGLDLGDVEPPAARVETPLIYGADGRIELFQARTPIDELGRSAIVAVMDPAVLDHANSPELAIRAAPLSVWDDYCPGERFLDQPTAAQCGAVLIDDDLVLTAAHCLEGTAACRDWVFAFDYLYRAEQDLASLNRGSIYGCRQIAISRESAVDADELFDFAIVQLDRAPTLQAGVPRLPAPVRPEGVVMPGEPLAVLGFPLGLPLKVDDGALAGDPRVEFLDAFTLSSDTYSSSSGSAVVDAEGRVAGVMTRGRSDFVDRGSCRASRVLGPNEAGETANYARTALQVLCESGWPSMRLCGTDVACGDGVCSFEESPASCNQDCESATCGDLLCETAEWDSCPDDCGDRRPTEIPTAWYCRSEWYDDGETCDCDCGASDPDCGGGRGCDALGPAGRSVEVPKAAEASEGCSAGRRPHRGRGTSVLLLLLALGVASWGVRVRARISW